MPLRLVRQSVVIANGAAVSSQEIDGMEYQLVGLEMPAAWTAAGISFMATVTDGPGATFVPVQSAGAEVALTVVAATYVTFGGADVAESVAGMGRFKVCSGPSSARVNQGAARTIWCALLPRT